MKKRLLQIAGLVVLGVIAVGLYYGVRSLWIVFSTLNPELGAALVTGFFTVTVSIGAVVLGRYFEKAKEVTEVYREKRQKVYEEFIEQFQKITIEENSKPGKPDRMVTFLREFNRKIILWAGPDTVRAYVDMMSRLTKNSGAASTVFSMETFYKAMRKDLGLSNTGILRGDFLSLTLRFNEAEEFVAASRENPHITLQELAARRNAAPPSGH